jgi:hypothetical protein
MQLLNVTQNCSRFLKKSQLFKVAQKRKLLKVAQKTKLLKITQIFQTEQGKELIFALLTVKKS